MARLLVKRAEGGEQIIELKLGANRLGRSAECDFQIEHSSVSAVHCEIRLSGEGVSVRDCASTNGTFLQGNRIHESPLAPGQTLYLGEVAVLVESVDVTIAIPKFKQDLPAPPVVLDDGAALCPRHPHAKATHQCTFCREIMCDACVHQLRRRGGKLFKLCPLCSHSVQRIGGEPKKKKKLMDYLHATVRIPFLTHRGPPKE
jgi:hypothetical protein